MARKLIAYCGIDCAKCPIFVLTHFADRTGWKKLSQRVMRSMLRLGGIKPDGEVWCDGCTAIDARTHKPCRECLVRCCAMERGVVSCAHCVKFNCDWLQQLWPRLRFKDAKPRLLKLRKQIEAEGKAPAREN